MSVCLLSECMCEMREYKSEIKHTWTLLAIEKDSCLMKPRSHTAPTLQESHDSFFPKDGSASQIFHDFPTYFNIPIMKSNEEHTRLHNKKLDGHIISTMAGLAHEPSSSCQHRETQGHSKARRPQPWRSGCRSVSPPISNWENHVEYSTWFPSKSQSKADKNA